MFPRCHRPLSTIVSARYRFSHLSGIRPFSYPCLPPRIPSPVAVLPCARRVPSSALAPTPVRASHLILCTITGRLRTREESQGRQQRITQGNAASSSFEPPLSSSLFSSMFSGVVCLGHLPWCCVLRRSSGNPHLRTSSSSPPSASWSLPFMSSTLLISSLSLPSEYVVCLHTTEFNLAHILTHLRTKSFATSIWPSCSRAKRRPHR